MAMRPAWKVEKTKIFFKVVRNNFEFKFNPGFSVTQKRKNIDALHQAIGDKALEISTKSMVDFGRKLSAFNLKLNGIPLECVFQASKVYQYGGPYKDLLMVSPKEAKRDERHKSSGKLIYFEYEGKNFPLEPKTLFYDFIYIKSVKECVPLEKLKTIIQYQYFTDIEFNPQKSVNCQAKSLAIIKAMLMAFGEIPDINDISEFKKFYKVIQAENAWTTENLPVYLGDSFM